MAYSVAVALTSWTILACAAEPGLGDTVAARTNEARAASNTAPIDSTALTRRIREIFETDAAAAEGARRGRADILYESRGYAPRWIALHSSDRLLRQEAHALLRSIAQSDKEGLRPADYGLDTLTALFTAARATPRNLSVVAHLDVHITASFLAFARDLLHGRLTPSSVSPSWHIDIADYNVDSVLHAAFEASDAAAAIEQLRPPSHEYVQLLNALDRYRELARNGGWPALPSGPSLRLGDSSVRVRMLRERLQAERYVTTLGGLPSAPLHFDTSLAAAVAEFQATHGLAIDSIVGPETRRALNVPAELRARQIAANLERMRWLPRLLGDRHVIVNVPEFRLAAYDRGKLLLTMRVIVGADYSRRGTPAFSDSMQYVVFNPYWNVPASIAVNELLPSARRNRAFLSRQDYEIVTGVGRATRRVSPDSLRDADFRSYRYRIRQRPGPLNALGQVKFMFPNDYSVYLHDTPASALFDERKRAFSHGCVRVAQPAALAHFALGPQGWSLAEIDSAMSAGIQRRVDLDRPIPVYIVYLTAFVRSGKLSFRPDLYDHDRPLLEALADDGSAQPSGVTSLLQLLQP